MNKLFLFLLILAGLVVTGCASTPTVVTASVEQSRPSFQFTAPAKPILAPIAFDWPRKFGFSKITNSRKCIDAAKAIGMGRDAVYPTEDVVAELPKGCDTPAVDEDSNLFIGLDEANYNNLINNYNILLSRDPLWQGTLDAANNTLRQKKVK